jgi:hypothetical protein
MHEPTIQVITRPPELLDAEPEPESQVIWRDKNGKIYFRNNPALPILRYPNSKVVDKPDDAPDKCKSCTRECLVAIRRYLLSHRFSCLNNSSRKRGDGERDPGTGT